MRLDRCIARLNTVMMRTFIPTRRAGTFVAGMALFLGAFTEVSGVEPLVLRLVPTEAEATLGIPAGFEARLLAVVEDGVYALPRFSVYPSGTAGDAVEFHYRVLDYDAQRVWVPDQETEEDDSDSDGGVLFTVLFGWLFKREIIDEDGRWMFDTSATIRGELRRSGERGTLRTFTLSSYVQHESAIASREAVIEDIAQSIEGELKRLYILHGEATAAGGDRVSLDFGADVGVEYGSIYRVDSDEHTDAVSLVRVVDVADDGSIARVVRRAGTVDSTGSATEHLDSVVDLRLDLLMDLPAQEVRPGGGNETPSMGASLTVVAAPYAPLYGGGGIRLFAVDDSRGRRDAGFGVFAFGAGHLVHRPRLRIAALLGGELGFVFRPDDDGDGASVFVPALWPAVEVSILVAPHVDIVLGGGYRFSIETEDWQIPGDEAEVRDASFDGSAPSVSTAGAFAVVGMRYAFF